jgi:DNA-binding response OmpR family regulator
VLGWLEPSLSELGVGVIMADTGEELEQALLRKGPIDLVVTSAQMSGTSALQVLARVRGHEVRTPFILVMGFHGEFARIMVSDGSSVTLSARLVDQANFVALATSFVRPPARTTVPCGPPEAD